MAKKPLVKRVQSYDEYYAEKGMDDSVLYAYTKAVEVALTSEKEKDVPFGLELAKSVKQKIRDFILEKKGYTFERLERYCLETGNSFKLTESYYKIEKACAYYSLESFISYMEKNRPLEKRFYYPRKATLEVVLKDLEDLDNRVIKYYGLSLPPRVGKLLSDDTLVLTKDGWKKHGNLSVGDFVVGKNGEWVKVTYVHPKNIANKRVWFSDHTYIDCHENHEWLVYDRFKLKEHIVETRDLANSEYFEGEKRRYRYQLPLCEAVKGTQKTLPMNPYVLGAWLGDGTNRKPVITICDTDNAILEEIESKGYLYTACHKQVGCKAYSFSGLRADLQRFGMCHSDVSTYKHIPEEYFNASLEQRLELLAGLIDTDGTLTLKEHRYSISTVEERLKDDIVELVNSFGWRVCVTSDEPRLSSSGIQGKKTVYRISFNPTFEIPCKVERKQLKEFSKPRRIAVVKVEDIEPKRGNCITVEGGLYRAGKSMKLTHNSTICIFFLAWVALRKPNSNSAMGGHSGILAKGFYKELLNLMTSAEYTYGELYKYWNPKHELIQDKSAEDLTINLDEPSRFSTLVCRGIDGTWTGAVNISPDGVLYVDDLVRDREHSMSPRRMEDTFQEYLNKMVDRMNDGAVELNVGTLWGVLDPMERMRILYENDPNYRFRRIPALDPITDESNFDYLFNGFSTEYYHKMRERLEEAEWMAKYQQAPFVREGLLFPKDELIYSDGIMPDEEHKVWAVLDPAVGGGDNCSMPICWQGQKNTVISWLYDKRTQKHTVPRIVDKIINFYITELYIEKNGVGRLFEDEIKREMSKRGCNHCSIRTYSAPVKISKEDKIRGYSDAIKSKFEFLVERRFVDNPVAGQFVRDSDYEKAMTDMHIYTSIGKNTTDDAPDSMSQMAMTLEKQSNGRVEVVHNPFKGMI